MKNYFNSNLSEAGMIEVFEKYKKIVENEFFPTRGFGKVRLSTARKAISDFKKISTSNTDISDIMLFYVENGVEFTNEYGDIDEAFYMSIESMYQTALKFICKANLLDDFYERCQAIVNNTANIGWGFHDGLSDTFYTYFQD